MRSTRIPASDASTKPFRNPFAWVSAMMTCGSSWRTDQCGRWSAPITSIRWWEVRHGITTDSNLVCYLQSGLAPLHHWAGLLRLPVFWEDDVHWARGGSWTFAPYAELFFSSGLKILNFHPFLVALNVPDASFYSLHKRHIPTLTREQAESLRYQGAGCATFLVEMLESILAAGHRFVHLSDLAAEVRAETREPENKRNARQ